MNLADCYEKSGQTASAWATWLEAAAVTKQAGQTEREQLARKRAEALKARLVHIEVSVPAPNRVPGLEVRKDDVVIRDATWGVAVPIDPGTHTISAKAPGFRSWNTTIIIVEGKKPANVVVPRLEADTRAGTGSATTKPSDRASEFPSAPPAAPGTPSPKPAGPSLGAEQPPTQAPAAPPPTNGPAAQQSDQSPAPGAHMTLSVPEVDQPKSEQSPTIRTASFVVHLGAQGGGSGTDKFNCSGDCTGINNSSTDFNVGGAAALSLGAMFKIGKLFRIGPELMHTFKMSTSGNTNPETVTYGSGDISVTNFDVVTELVPRVSQVIWLVPRIQLGVSAVDLSGALGNQENSFKAQCNAKGLSGCDSLSSPHFGGHVGLGFGAMFATGDRLRLRVDALVDVMAAETGNVSGINATSAGQVTETETIAVTRALLFAGLEI